MWTTLSVGECVCYIQDILRATIGQLWKLDPQWDSSALEEKCPDYQEARLPEAGVWWGMVSLQDIEILLFSWRDATAELCSVLVRECPSRAKCFFLSPKCFFSC